jgi:hypothetical protein
VQTTKSDLLLSSVGQIAARVRAAVLAGRASPTAMIDTLNSATSRNAGDIAEMWNDFDPSADLFVSSFCKFSGAKIDFGTGVPVRIAMAMKSLPWMVRVVPQPEGQDWLLHAPASAGWDRAAFPGDIAAALA